MKAKKVLFVCTGNFDRSPTAEAMYKDAEGLEVKSAGTWMHAQNPLTKELVEWADAIYVMEEHHKTAVTRLDPKATDKTVVLGVPDIYRRDQPELKALLRQKLDPYLKQ
ncbi:phosphotyrosine protein phosphatase [Candidatus Bathyarchaeota archaeon]|nr:phosphotyrosine protein phosphatase [Candidatus Bathyarchaeota archaeon]